MNNLLIQLKDQTLAIWGRLTTQQKLILSGSVVLFFAVLIYVVMIASKTEYVTVVSKAEPKEVGEMLAQLSEAKIPAQAIEGSTALQVPVKEKDAAIAALATAGYPKGNGASIGFESLTQPGLGETEKDKDLKYILALQGELERTLRSFKGVERARVQIAQGKQSLFSEEETPTTASVFLELASTQGLDPKAVMGIVHLISKSVQNLQPQDVTVVDNLGNTLSDGLFEDPKNQPPGKVAADLMQIKKDLEKHIEKKVGEIAAKVVGRGNAVVNASVELVASTQSQKSTIYPTDPKPQILSQQTETEESTNTSQAGVPGTDTNIPGAEAQTGGSGSYTREKTTTNWNVSTVETSTETPSGEIKRLTLSVVVGKQLDENALASLEMAVRNAANINPDRGDSVSVTSLPFDDSEAKEAQALKEAEEARALYMTIGAVLLAALLAAAGYLVWKKRNEKLIALRKEEEYSIADMVPEPEEVELSPEELEKLALREQIEGLVDKNPEAVAKLLKTWISDEGR